MQYIPEQLTFHLAACILSMQLLNCTADETETVARDGGTSCEMRSELYTAQTVFALRSGDTTYDHAPQCVRSCGSVGESQDGLPHIDSLPAGSCRVGEEMCQMGAAELCSHPEQHGAFSNYGCKCIDASWSCVILTQGGGICPR